MLLPSVRIGTISHLNVIKLIAVSTRTRTAVRRGFSPKTSRRMRLKAQDYKSFPRSTTRVTRDQRRDGWRTVEYGATSVAAELTTGT
jgi:hypothetical protein